MVILFIEAGCVGRRHGQVMFAGAGRPACWGGQHSRGETCVRLGIQPTVDFAFKKIFGTPENVPILLGLVNSVLQLVDPIVDVEILNPFSHQEFEDDKLIVLDIRARDAAGRWLNIEMQVSVYPGLLQRLAYYACALYVEQLQAGQHYTRLRPAISIGLLNQVLFADTPAAWAVENAFEWVIWTKCVLKDCYAPQRHTPGRACRADRVVVKHNL